MVSIIVAMTKDRVIGSEGKVPWRIKEDVELFKDQTMGNTVIMGKATWLSIPEKFRPLPNRDNIVISTTLGQQPGVKVCRTIAEALEEAKKKGNEAYCIGGGQLYSAMLPISDTMYISWVKQAYKGDTYFPEVDFTKWKEESSKEFADFMFKKYLRIATD